MTFKTLQISTFALSVCLVASAGNLFADEKAGPPADDAQTYLLRYQFEAGVEMRYESRQEVTQQAVAPAGQKVDVSRVQQRRLFRVGNVNQDGVADVSMQFEHVRMETQSDDREPTIFDSSMKDAEVPGIFKAAAHKLKGAAPSYVVRPSGIPLTEEGYEDVSESGHASFMIPLPDKPVAVGDSWKAFMNVKVRVAEGIMRDIKLLRTYKLDSVDNDTAKIRFSTSVAVRVRSPSAKAQLLQATPQGIIEFDMARGLVISKEMTFERSVLGALGANTILSATGKTTETLIEGDNDSTVTKR